MGGYLLPKAVLLHLSTNIIVFLILFVCVLVIVRSSSFEVTQL